MCKSLLVSISTVPDLGTSNRKGSVANGGPVGLWLDEAASVGGAESSSTW